MDKRPFFLTCPKCGHQRFVLPIKKSYHCESCGSRIRVLTQGSYLIESVVLAPGSLVIYWGIAAFLQSHGLTRDASQGWGIFAAFLITLPAYVALRPYVVGLECEPGDESIERKPRDSDG